MIGQTVTHYTILEHLGGGGMGVVYKAHDLKLDRFVALKFLPPDLTRGPEARQRLIREAQAASSLQHTNICVVYDVDEAETGQMFICMEYLSGKTLKEKIEEAFEAGGLPKESIPPTGHLVAGKVEDAVNIAIQVAQGLARAHEHGIIHRDIKPANIMVTTDGIAKIVDFGLARLPGRSMLTRVGSTLGTAAYMSPEQARGDEVDQRTDVWSLGVVLYETITGRLPFRGEYENAIIYSVLNAEPAPLTTMRADVPLALERVVQKCLSKDPRERYQQMDELLADLRSCLNAPPQAGMRAHRPMGRPKPRTLLAFGVGILALALIAYVLTSQRAQPTSSLKMIAVLPFENLGPAEDEYFADGLTDEITSRLSAIRSLGVISRTSSIQYKKTTKSLPAIAKELGVDYILEGTIRWVKTGNNQRIRITPELIKVSDDVHLWTDNLDRTLDDIFAIQTEIATRVVGSLDIVLGENQKRAIEAVPTRNLDAYQLYLRGLSFVDRIERPNLESALSMFQRAVELDSTFALAYAQLARAHLIYSWLGFDRPEVHIPLAKQAIDRAFALQSDLPDAYIALGTYYLFGFRDYEKALDAFETVTKQDPNNRKALEYIAYIWRRQGKFEEAIGQLKKTCELDPKNAIPLLEIGNTLRMLGRYADAETYLDRSISITPDYSDAFLWKAAISVLWHGDTRESRDLLEQVPKQYEFWYQLTWLDIYDRNYQSALDRLARAPVATYMENMSEIPASQLRGFIYRFMGDSVRSRTAFDSARVFLESEVKVRPGDFRPHKSLGLVYAGLGKADAAIHEAELAMQLLPLSRDAWAGVGPIVAMAQVYATLGMKQAAHDKLAYLLSLHGSKEVTVPLLRLDPIYDPLRGDPAFLALLAKGQ